MMIPIIQPVETKQTPDSLMVRFRGLPGVTLLRSADVRVGLGRYSLVAPWPFLRFRSWGARCELERGEEVAKIVKFGDPWRVLEELMARYETSHSVDFPFPLGGCFGFWGYDLKGFVEPRLRRRSVAPVGYPDCEVGFHDSLVVFDHYLGKVWLVSTGLMEDGSFSEHRARQRAEQWREYLGGEVAGTDEGWRSIGQGGERELSWRSSTSRDDYLTAVRRAQEYIRAGDIYQVNLAHRLTADIPVEPSVFFRRLTEVSPAPFAAWHNGGEYQIASSSPELFLRMSGRQVTTQPIKGTRPRGADLTQDAQLSYQLQTSAKERAELLMITDLLRNDLGRVCEYGSVMVPDLMRLERFAQVQHLISTVEGRLRSEVSHVRALAACFPGGSITGAPKIRAMEVIDELEPIPRGPYTGALGYLGFNRESQLSILIRTAVLSESRAHFYVGAGIVADSDPEAEYEETLVKARAFTQLAAVDLRGANCLLSSDRDCVDRLRGR